MSDDKKLMLALAAENDKLKAENQDELKAHHKVEQSLIEQRNQARAEIDKLKADAEKLVAALELYEPKERWDFYCDCCATGETPLEKDQGSAARDALKEWRGDIEKK